MLPVILREVGGFLCAAGLSPELLVAWV